ncbi:MAG: hypothetical protein AABW64_00820 [Nanoarchaeota archaeon]
MKLFKPIRDALFVTFLVLFFYSLFLILGILQQIDYAAFTSADDQLSGNAIRVGNKIIINGTPDSNNKPPQIKPPAIELSKNLRCWKRAGMTAQDLAIVGNLLQAASCEEPTTKKNVRTTLTADCLQLSVDGEITTNFCYSSPEETPSVSIVVPNTGEGSVSLPETKRNYLPALLFLVILFSAFGFWSWDELRGSFTRQERFKPYDELELLYGSHRAPNYHIETLAAQEDSEYIDKLYQKLMREKELASTPLPFSKKVLPNKIFAFNAQCDLLTAAIKRNDLVGAQRTSDDLFSLFFPLYCSVVPEHRNIILERMLALDKQYKLLKKSASIASLIRKTYDGAIKNQISATPQAQQNRAEKQKDAQDLDQHIRTLQRTIHKRNR